ncbi:MAG: hypothetical protein IPH84_20630 [Bacteroidales bacterium]|nr:hypothetical protein [Bacteroidales bacterium]
MKAIVMFLVLFIMSDFSLAQQKEPQANRKSNTSGSSFSSTNVEVAAGTGLDMIGTGLEGKAGSIYIGDEWPEGELVLKGGKMIENYRFRYDIYSDQMQFITGQDTLAFASPSELSSISFSGKTFVYEPYECNGMLLKGYFELEVPGRKQLLLKRSITYQMPDEGENSLIKEDKYLVGECYFIKSANQPARKIMCSKKQALVAMDDKKAELEEYMMKTGNKVKTPNDLKKMVEYYNSLE